MAIAGGSTAAIAMCGTTRAWPVALEADMPSSAPLASSTGPPSSVVFGGRSSASMSIVALFTMPIRAVSTRWMTVRRATGLASAVAPSARASPPTRAGPAVRITSAPALVSSRSAARLLAVSRPAGRAATRMPPASTTV